MSKLLISSFVRKLLRSLTKNERMSESLIFRQKTSDVLGKPMSEFPALIDLDIESKRHSIYLLMLFSYVLVSYVRISL